MKLHWNILLIIHITLHLCSEVASQRNLRSRSGIERTSTDYDESLSSTESHAPRRSNRKDETEQKATPRSYSRRVDNASGRRKDIEPVRMDVVVSEPAPTLPRSYKSMRTGRRKDSPTAIIPVVNNGAFADTRRGKVLPNMVRLVINPEDTPSASEPTSRENRQALRRQMPVAPSGRGRQRYSQVSIENPLRRSDFIDESNLEIYNLDMETGKIQGGPEYTQPRSENKDMNVFMTPTPTQTSLHRQAPQRRRTNLRTTTTEAVEQSTENARLRSRNNGPPRKVVHTPIEAFRDRPVEDKSTERVISKYRTRLTSEKPTQKQRLFRERDNVVKSTTTSDDNINTSTIKAVRSRPVRPLALNRKSISQEASVDSNQNKAGIQRGNFRPNLKSDSSGKIQRKDNDEEDYENENYPEHFKSILQAKLKSAKSPTQEALSTKASEVVLNLRQSDDTITTFSPPRRKARVRPIPLMDESPEGIENSKDPIETERTVYRSKFNQPGKVYKSQELVLTSSTELPKKTSPKFTRTYIFNATRNNLLKKEKAKENQEIISTERNIKFSPIPRTKFQKTKSTNIVEVTPRYSSEDNNLLENPSSEAYRNVISDETYSSRRVLPTLVTGQNQMRTLMRNPVVFKPKKYAQRKHDKGYPIMDQDSQQRESVIVTEKDKYVVPLNTGQRTHRFSARYKSPLNKPSPPAYNPTVPSVTSTTAWLKFFVTDAPIPENLTEPIWFVAADGQSQWKSDHQIIRASDHHMTDVGDESNIYPDIEIISFDQPRSTPPSDNLITAESAVMTSRLLNVETSNHSPSVTVSIFDALADILTSTPKIRTSTKKIVEDINVIGVSTESVSGSTKGSLIKDIESTRIESTVQSESDTSQVTTNKPVKTSPRSTPNSSPHIPSITFSSPDISSAPSTSPTTTLVTERKPFATLILYSTTQPPAHTASLASSTFVTPVIVSRTEQTNSDVFNNNNLPSDLRTPNQDTLLLDDNSNTLLSDESSSANDNNNFMFNFAFLYNFITNTTPPNNEFKKRFETLILNNLKLDELQVISSTTSATKVDNSVDNNSVETTSPLSPVSRSRFGDEEIDNIQSTTLSSGSSTRQSRLLETLDSKLDEEIIIITPSLSDTPMRTTTESETYYSSTTENTIFDVSTTQMFPQQNSLESTFISDRKSSDLSVSEISANFFMENTEDSVVKVTSPSSEFTTLSNLNYVGDATSTQPTQIIYAKTVTSNSESITQSSELSDISTEQSLENTEETMTNESTVSVNLRNYFTNPVTVSDSPKTPEVPTTETTNSNSFDIVEVNESSTTTEEYTLTSEIYNVTTELIFSNSEKSTQPYFNQNRQAIDSTLDMVTSESTTINQSTDFTSESQSSTPTTIIPSPNVKPELLTILNMLASFNVNASSDSTIPKQSLSRRAKLLRDIEKIILENDIGLQDDGNSSSVEFSDVDNKDLQVITIPALKDIMSTIFPDVVSSSADNITTTLFTNTEQTTGSYITLNTKLLSRSNFISDNTDILTNTDSTEKSSTTTEIQTQETSTQISEDNTSEIETTTIPSTTPPYQWVPPFPTAWRNMQSSLTNSSQAQNGSVLATTERVNTTSRPKKDYYVYGVLPNNTVVRKNPNNNELETLTEASPFIIFGVLPNNSVIRRYPNGTRVPTVTQKIDVLPIDPRSLRNPNSPVYKDPESIKPIEFNNNVDDINTNEITQNQLIENPESNTNSKNNETTEVPVYITEKMLSNLTKTKQSSVVGKDSVTGTTESYVLSLLTTAKLPKAKDIVLSSIVAASKEESNKSDEESTTPRYLTLDIDPETKKIRTEKPADGSEGVVFRWKPITDDILTTPTAGVTKSTESYIQKITTTSRPITITTMTTTPVTSVPISTPSSVTSTINTMYEKSTPTIVYTSQTPTQYYDTQRPTGTTVFDIKLGAINKNTISSVEISSRGGKSQSYSGQQFTNTISTTPYYSTTFAMSTTQNPPETTTRQMSTTTSTTNAPTTTTRRLSSTRSPPTQTTRKQVPTETSTVRKKITESTTRRRTEPPSKTTRRITSTTTTISPELSSAISRLKYFDIGQSPSLPTPTSTLPSTRAVYTNKPTLTSTTISSDKSTYSVDDDIAFLTTLQKLVIPKTETKEQTLANRIIALAVERNLANLKSSTHKPTTTSTTTTTTTTTTTQKPITSAASTTESFRGGKKYNIAINNNISTDDSKGIKTSTPSIEDDIASFQKDAQLLQSLLKLTGQDPSAINLPSILTTQTKNSQSSNSPLLVSPSTISIISTTRQSTTTHRPQTVRNKTPKPTDTPKKASSIDVEKLKEEAILLQNLLKIQNAGESSTLKINLASLDDEKTLAALLAATKKPISTTSLPIKLSTEYGKSNEALLAALLKDQGIGPTTPQDQKKLAALLNQVIVTPKARTTTTRRPTTTRQPRPLLDGLAWLWQQWQDTGSGPVSGGSRGARRPTPVSAGGGGFLFGSGPFVGNAGDDVADEKPQSSNKVPLPPPQVVDSTSSSNTGLVTAAINVTRAFSQFLGAAIQGAASTIQTVVKAGQRAAGNYYSAGSG